MLLPLLLAAALLPPVPGALTRAFDPPPAPFTAGHRGVDLASAPGEPVKAVLPGVVRFSGLVAKVSWVSIDHGGGLITSYGPLDPRLVSAGQQVARGQVLGRLAASSTALDWGARLHGSYIDPLLLLQPWQPYLINEQGW